MSHLYAWLGLPDCDLNLEALVLGIPESDSHYHMKYTHTQSQRVHRPIRHELPPRIQAKVESAYAWFYQMYYPQKNPQKNGTETT